MSFALTYLKKEYLQLVDFRKECQDLFLSNSDVSLLNSSATVVVKKKNAWCITIPPREVADVTGLN